MPNSTIRPLGRWRGADAVGGRGYIRDANAGGRGERGNGASAGGEGGDPAGVTVCQMKPAAGGFAGQDEDGATWRMTRNPDGGFTLIRRPPTGDEDPDQVLLEQPPGAGGELPQAGVDRLRRALAPRTGDLGGSLDIARIRAIQAVNRAHYGARVRG